MAPRGKQSPEQRETTGVRVTNKTNLAIGMIVNELKAFKSGRRVTQDEAIWNAIQRAYPHIAARVEELLAEAEAEEDSNS